MTNPIDTVTAKIKGVQKGLEARREGLVGVFHTLAKQHGEATALIERVNDDTSKREALWPKIRIELLAHEKGELEAVYPALARYKELQHFVEQHAREAKQLENLIIRLETLSMESQEWMSSFIELRGTVIAHAAEEEQQIFPAALQLIGSDRAKELDHAFKSAQKDVEASLKKTVH